MNRYIFVASTIFIFLTSNSQADMPIPSPDIPNQKNKKNEFILNLYDTNYNPINTNAEQRKSLTSSRYDYWVTEGQNPDNHKPVCDIVNFNNMSIYVSCHWNVGRHKSSSNKDKFTSYLDDNFSSVVTAANNDDMEASLPKSHMNFGWAGSLDFTLYAPEQCSTVGQKIPTKKLHLYFVLGQTGSGGLAKLLYDTKRAYSKVMKCVEEEGAFCEVKVVKSFKNVGEDLTTLWNNVWSIGTNASQAGNPYQKDNLLWHYASKIIKTDLTTGGIGSTALVGYLQDEKGKVYRKLQYTIRQSAQDSDHSMDLILSDEILKQIYDNSKPNQVCTEQNLQKK